MSAHTPGPLKVVNGGLSQLAIVAKDGNAVAFVPRGHPDADANSNLFAAAPDLLAALKLVEFGNAVTHHKCVACSGWDVGPNGETPRAHTKDCPVRAAIAKAEGRS